MSEDPTEPENEAEADADTEPDTDEDTEDESTSETQRLEDELDEKTDIVFVGSKPPMSYVQAAMTSFNEDNEKVVMKARGRAISNAVDAAEILRRDYLPDVDIENIEISTEEVENDEGETIKLSSIRITLG